MSRHFTDPWEAAGYALGGEQKDVRNYDEWYGEGRPERRHFAVLARPDSEGRSQAMNEREVTARMASDNDHRHSPCPVCGKHTRYKQFRSRCACNLDWPEDQLPWNKAEKERRR